MRGLPNALSALRLALAPVLLALAWSGAPRAFVCCLALSLMTGIADGRIARRTGQTSERGAVLDSWADLATYASLPPRAWWLRPGFVRAEALFLLVAVASYVAPVAIVPTEPVPDSILERMTRAPSPEAAREEGIAIAREMLVAVHGMVQGAQISAPLGKYSAAVDVLEALGSAGAGAG